MIAVVLGKRFKIVKSPSFVRESVKLKHEI